MPKPLIYLTAIALFIALAPMPYGYYTLLKIMACGVFAWAAYISYSNKLTIQLWLFAGLALLFNPIIPIYLSKELWMPIDIGSGVSLLLNMKKLSVWHREKPLFDSSR